MVETNTPSVNWILEPELFPSFIENGPDSWKNLKQAASSIIEHGCLGDRCHEDARLRRRALARFADHVSRASTTCR